MNTMRVHTCTSDVMLSFSARFVTCRYGQMVSVRHENGLSTLYAHCSSILVREGQVSIVHVPGKSLKAKLGQGI